MATNGDFSDEDSALGSPLMDAANSHDDLDDQEPLDNDETEVKPLKSAMKQLNDQSCLNNPTRIPSTFQH
jgi:translation initiation factor 2 subunit 3